MYRRLSVVLSAAILFVSTGCHEKPSNPGPGILATNVPVVISNDSTNATSCFMDNPWPSMKSTQTVTFATSTTNGYRIIFSGQQPLATSQNASSGVPYIDVTPGSTPVPYYLTSPALNGCSSSTPGGCYVTFDVQVPAGGGGSSCEKHYNNYYTGIHIDR